MAGRVDGGGGGARAASGLDGGACSMEGGGRMEGLDKGGLDGWRCLIGGSLEG